MWYALGFRDSFESSSIFLLLLFPWGPLSSIARVRRRELHSRGNRAPKTINGSLHPECSSSLERTSTRDTSPCSRDWVLGLYVRFFFLLIFFPPLRAKQSCWKEKLLGIKRGRRHRLQMWISTPCMLASTNFQEKSGSLASRCNKTFKLNIFAPLGSEDIPLMKILNFLFVF